MSDQTTESTTQPEAETTAVPEPSRGDSLVDSIAALVEAFVAYLRQQAEALVREKVAEPIAKAGTAAGIVIVASFVVCLGLAFTFAGLLAFLAQWIGWPGALLATGILLLVVSFIAIAARPRSTR